MCDYFILTKPREAGANQDDQNQLYDYSHDNVYILPLNNFDYYKEYGLFEKELIEWCKQFCSTEKNMLDIGAHSGTYTVSLAEYCRHVYAFEPQRMTFYALCGSVALSNRRNATCIPMALGSPEQVGSTPLYIVSQDGGGSSVHRATDDTVLDTETIEIRTLDSFGLKNIGFIKLDVENNELQTLQGGVRTLQESAYPPILFEMNVVHEALVQFLATLGYTTHKLVNSFNMYFATH